MDFGIILSVCQNSMKSRATARAGVQTSSHAFAIDFPFQRAAPRSATRFGCSSDTLSSLDFSSALLFNKRCRFSPAPLSDSVSQLQRMHCCKLSACDSAPSTLP
ncbi:hypothetical protein DPSP01_009840 [Paraphaeosphaeria sporulosa]